MIESLTFVLFTAVNAIVWRIVPCEWSHPYADRATKAQERS